MTRTFNIGYYTKYLRQSADQNSSEVKVVAHARFKKINGLSLSSTAIVKLPSSIECPPFSWDGTEIQSKTMFWPFSGRRSGASDATYKKTNVQNLI